MRYLFFRKYTLRKINKYVLILLLILTCFNSCTLKQNGSKDDFTFIVAADWRYTTTEPYHTTEYFLGALEAIADVGKGAFMLSPGDVEPPSQSRALISQVLGADYPWYAVVGNHELEDPTYMDYLRQLNRGEKSLPNIVRKGPPGCEETTFSFDYGDCHFVVLNQYFNGESDMGTDGDVVPELLAWLDKDLAANRKKFVFVAGHEPLLPIPDMHNGRLRKRGTALDKYPDNAFNFYQLLMKYGVNAYFNGHTHNASIARINGLWQVDTGHARGIEDLYPEMIFQGISSIFTNGKETGMTRDQAVQKYFWKQPYAIKKVLDYLELTNNVYYKELADEPALKALKFFFAKAEKMGDVRSEFFRTYWNNWDLSRSTFMKIRIRGDNIFVDVYRNDAKGGPYSLVYTEKLQ